MKNLLLISLVLLTSGLAQASEIYFEKSRDLPLVFINLIFKGGSTQDPEGKSGVTDLMARLLLRGTKNKTKQQIDLALDNLGANLGVETRAEFVALRGSVLSENFAAFLALLEEVIAQPSFQSVEFEKLKKEQISQIAGELSSDRNLVKLRFEQNFFKGHPYSKPNDGKIKDIQSLTLEDIKTQFQKLVNPNRLIILATGDSSDSVIQDFSGRLNQYKWTHVDLKPLPAFTTPPKKMRVVLIDKPDRTQTQVMIGQMGIPFNDPSVDPLHIANFAFGGGSFHSRLMVELRVKRGWTYGAGSGFKFGTQPHSWRLSFFPKNADTPPAVKESLNLLRALKTNGITQAEYDFSKQSLMNSAGFAFNTPSKRMENRMNEILFGLPNGYYRDFAKRLSVITLDQVNQAVKDFIDPHHILVAVVATAKVTRADLAKSLDMPESEIEVIDYQKE